MAERGAGDSFWYIAINKMARKFSKKIARKMRTEDYLTVKRVFEKSGGSWYQLTNGDLGMWERLRNACMGFLVVRKRNKLYPFERHDKDGE